jgi:hypothetical protein
MKLMFQYFHESFYVCGILNLDRVQTGTRLISTMELQRKNSYIKSSEANGFANVFAKK